MSLPAKVKIGFRDYEVVVEPSPDFAEMRHGECDCTLGRIRIAEKISTTPEGALTFLHEILHGVWAHWEIKHGDKTEEQYVAQFAEGLSQVFRDNPDVLSYLKGALK